MNDTKVGAEGTFGVEARVVLFGFDPCPAVAYIRPRPRAWRIAGAVRTGALTLVVAPVMGIVPPHVPWILGALGVGTVLGHRRLHHRFTLEALNAECPKCGSGLAVRPSRLKIPHTVPCEGCHHEATLRIDDPALDALVPHTA